MPDASQHFGNIEIGVNPGIVLSSLTYEAVGGEEEVHAGEPAAVDGLERTDAELLDRRDLVVGQIGRAHDIGPVAAEVLALEVVELARRQHDLAGQRRPCGRSAATFEDRDLDLAARDRRLDEHLVVLRERELERGRRAPRRRAPSTPRRSTLRAQA